MKIISKNKEIRYEQVTTDNMDLAFNIQKNEWKDNPDKENFLDKAINAKKDYVSFIAYYNNVPIGITGVYTENIDKECGCHTDLLRAGFGPQVPGGLFASRTRRQPHELGSYTPRY